MIVNRASLKSALFILLQNLVKWWLSQKQHILRKLLKEDCSEGTY